MSRKVDPRIIAELQRQEQAAKQPPPVPFPPTPVAQPPQVPAPAPLTYPREQLPEGRPIIIHHGGTSACSIALGIIAALLFLALIPWLLAGGCLAGCAALFAGAGQ